MSGRKRLTFIFCLLACAQCWAGTSPGKSFAVVAQNSDSWEIEYSPAVRVLSTVEVDGKIYFRFDGAAVSDNEEESEGTPALPADAFSLGIPDGATVTAELVNPEFETTDHQLVAPHPGYKITDEQEAVEVFKNNGFAYTRNSFFPSTQITIEPSFKLRSQRIVCIRIKPYQYNPSTQTLRRIVKARLVVRLQTLSGRGLLASHVPDPFFEETYKFLLLNYEQARAWRIAPQKSVSVDPTATWFETGKFYYKALVAADGWYKITRSDLIAAGANLSFIDLPSLKVFAKGQEVPVVVRPDTTVEFYAYRNVGDSAYTDYYTDTSAYWLTWGGSTGSRFAASTPAVIPSISFTSAISTIHQEQNLSYFSGTTQDEQINNNTVPGEDWYWRSFGVNTQIDFSFSLDSADAAAPTSTVRARVFGTGYNASPSPPAQHRARVWINDSLAGDVLFVQRTGATLSATIPTSWLKVGANVFRLKNVDTGTSNNTFYLDWFEIDYPRKLRATNNLVRFSSPTLPSGSQIQCTIRGFSNSQIEVYDLSTRRMLAGGTVSGDSLSGFSINFPDTASVPHTYVVFAGNSQVSVPSLKQKMFA
ncbi:MAG: C25 family peptidase propeptide domain-containing protein, partial [bacterium]